jgi:hypothetical protein
VKDMDKDYVRTLYNTSADMMKHFNSLLDKVRIIVVTVGIGVFAASAKLYFDNGIENKFVILLVISSWGILFTLSMWFLANHYLMHTTDIAEAAIEAEEKLLNESGISCGAFKKIHSGHEEKNNVFEKVQNYSTFVSMLIGNATIFIFSIVKLLKC